LVGCPAGWLGKTDNNATMLPIIEAETCQIISWAETPSVAKMQFRNKYAYLRALVDFQQIFKIILDIFVYLFTGKDKVLIYVY